MRNSSMLLFFFLFILCDLPIATSTPPYIAVDNIALSCGASGNLTDRGGRLWIGDINSGYTLIEEPNHKSRASTAEQQGYIDAVPYKTARISSSPFTYQFRVTPGPKFLRLYFFNVLYQGFYNATSLFTVKAGSFTLLSNFGGGSISREFCFNVGEGKTLNVTFIPSPSESRSFYAFVNGIEIVSMPNDLYYRQDIPYLGQDFLFSIDKSIALEMFARLNMGGGNILPVADTGMFREWSPSSNYNLAAGVITGNPPNFKPIYSIIPNYTAPDDVYRSATLMGKAHMFGLKLTVDSGFDYMVRLHFCEIDPNITSVGERPFIIYINENIADDSADVLLWSKTKDTPVYKDFVVRIQNNTSIIIALDPKGVSDSAREAILNGLEVFKLIDSRNAVAGPSPSTPQAQKTKKTIIIVVGSSVGILIVLTLACGMVLWELRKTKSNVSFYPLSNCRCWPKSDKGKLTSTSTLSLSGELCRHFTLEEIKRATQNFKEEFIIGVGGFGKVYKGLVNESTTTVAIKRLNSESKQGFREFRTEIEMLSRFRHVHLVSLIGYCNEEGEMILIYDFMANGTLRQHLYNTHNDPLSWKRRLQICVGAARGLDYLHTGVEQPIIHRDVKTTNILLDDKWKAKVSDFGLCKTVQEESVVSTVVKGTWGYLDPDYARSGQLTVRSDVYSFGVVLLEILCGRKALDHKLEIGQCNLANWARECMGRGTIGEIIDPYLKGKIAPECFKVYVEVAEGCVREQGIRRPTMNDVKEKLDVALKLQEIADADMEKLNSGGQYTYPEVLSFSIASHSEHGSETESGIGSGMTNSGWTSSTLDSDAITGPDAAWIPLSLKLRSFT